MKFFCGVNIYRRVGKNPRFGYSSACPIWGLSKKAPRWAGSWPHTYDIRAALLSPAGRLALPRRCRGEGYSLVVIRANTYSNELGGIRILRAMPPLQSTTARTWHRSYAQPYPHDLHISVRGPTLMAKPIQFGATPRLSSVRRMWAHSSRAAGRARRARRPPALMEEVAFNKRKRAVIWDAHVSTDWTMGLPARRRAAPELVDTAR